MAVYKELDREKFMRNNEVSQSRKLGGDYADTWKPQAGPTGKPNRHRIRLMPPHVNMDDVLIEMKMHFFPEMKDGRPVLKDGRPVPIGINCLEPFGEVCPAASGSTVSRVRRSWPRTRTSARS